MAREENSRAGKSYPRALVYVGEGHARVRGSVVKKIYFKLPFLLYFSFFSHRLKEKLVWQELSTIISCLLPYLFTAEILNRLFLNLRTGVTFHEHENSANVDVTESR